MTSSSSSASGHVVLHHHHQHHHAKFRWTENLTCRFIQLRKEHGKMFTGRKYSAQAGWEYILRQMREEFPTIMADVHYRVLKKKWSNLLQQYKELKNPVHGDKNKADDISWPFYTAIDEVLGNLTLPHYHHANSINDHDDDEDDLNPQEFLCVSVAPDDDDDDDVQVNYNDEDDDNVPGLPRLQPLDQEPVFDVERIPRITRQSRKRSGGAPTDEDSRNLLSRLPRATELTIRPVKRSANTCPAISELPPLEPINANGGVDKGLRMLNDARGVKVENEENEAVRPRKYMRRNEGGTTEDCESRLEKRIVEFFEYTKRRDEENRNILMRMLRAIEDIKTAVER